MVYEDLILAINGDMKTGLVIFNFVNNCKSEDYPEGNCQQAWKLLEQKFQPSTATNYIKLKKDFSNSKLKSIKEDPDDWITKLESIRSEMDSLCINSKKKKMEDEDFIIHILSNLPEEYEVAVNDLENLLSVSNPDEPLTIEDVREKLGARFSRLAKSDEEVEREKEEKAYAAFKKQYKKPCSYCGKLGHKSTK